MPLVILGLNLGTLPAWLPIWAVPVALVHVALFLALIVPAWVGLARARAGGPLSLVLVLPILGLLMLTPVYMNRVLPYAHWGRFWGILVLIPGLNIFFLWIFAFAPWKRRYIPLDQEEYSEATGMPRTGRSEPRLEGKSREPGQGGETIGPGAAPGFSREPGTMVPGAGFSPKSGEPGTMMAGAPANPPRAPALRSGPPSEQPNPTMIAGREGPQPLDEPVAPTPPIPARSLQPPQPPAAPPPVPAAPPPEPPRPRRGERTQDVSGKPPAEPTEAATMRVTPPPRPGGRAWRFVGANDVANAIDFTVQEPALLESDSGLLIGRSARAALVIEHDSVSRNHARFILERGALCLEDLDSMNGTWVDGRKLDPNTPVPLQPGGIVEIGKIKLRVTGG
jgi:FHA domain-containing protein